MPKKHAISNKTRKRPGRDLDQIQADMGRPEKLARLQHQPVDEDLPGAGQHYCVPCDRHFVDPQARQRHERSKGHKQRLHRLREPQHTQKDAELAAGLGTDTDNQLLQQPDGGG